MRNSEIEELINIPDAKLGQLSRRMDKALELIEDMRRLSRKALVIDERLDFEVNHLFPLELEILKIQGRIVLVRIAADELRKRSTEPSSFVGKVITGAGALVGAAEHSLGYLIKGVGVLVSGKAALDRYFNRTIQGALDDITRDMLVGFDDLPGEIHKELLGIGKRLGGAVEALGVSLGLVKPLASAS